MIKRKRKVIVLGTISISITVMICIYFILIFTGVINSNKNSLEITSSSDSIEYNGEELSCHNYEITKGTLHKGHTIDVKFLKSITNVGQIDNEVSVSILDSNNYDVTDEYDLKINTGLLTVLKREITITTSSKSKVYDGEELSSSDWYITKGNILKNHTLNVNVYSSITEIGQTPNLCQASVYNEKDEDVTANYSITFDYGTLTIERKTIKFFSENVSKTFDGKPYTPDPLKDFSFKGRLLNSSHKVIYESNPVFTSVGCQTYTFESIIIDENGNDVSSDYEIEYEYGKIEIVSQKISLRTGSVNKIYDGKEVLCEDFEITNNIKLIDGYEIVCNEFKPQIDVGNYENSCLCKILYEGEETSNYVIDVESLQFGLIVINPIEIKVSSENYIKEYDDEYCIVPDLIYDENLLMDGDFISYEKDNFKFKNVGTYPLSKDCYPNLNIINSNNESKLNNYNIKYELGSIIINKKRIILDLGIDSLTYDGNSHGWEEIDYKVANLDEDKFYIECEFDTVSQISQVGSLDLTPLSVRVYRKHSQSDDDVEENNDVSFNFDIAYNNYILNINPRNIVVSTMSAQKYYDGKTLTLKDDPNGFVISSGFLVVGHDASHNRCKSEIVEKGEIENEIDFTIKDENGVDVTSNYNIEYKKGRLEIKGIDIKISLIDNSKIYDGITYLEPGDIIDSLKYIKSSSDSDINHEIRVIYKGLSILDVGTYDITEEDIEFKVIENQEGQEIDVTSAYNLEFVGCTIEVNRRGISIATGSMVSHLTENPLQCLEYSYSGTLLEGHKLIGEFVSLDGVGTIENKAIFLVEDEEGLDVTSNYIFYYSYGTLTVKSSPGSDDKNGYGIAPEFLAYVYDGSTSIEDYVNKYNQDLENGNAQLLGVDQLVNKYGLTYKATVKVREDNTSEVGKYTLEIDTFKLFNNGYDVTESYNITYKTNTLQIYKYVLDISTESIEVDTYDGRILNSELNYSSIEAGHYIYIQSIPYISNVGIISSNEIEFIIKDDNGKDITESYLLNITYGTLHIKQSKTITLDLSDGSLIDIFGEETVEYNLHDLISYVDGIFDEDNFDKLKLTYTPATDIVPADYTLEFKIIKEIDGIVYDISNLYTIEVLFPED